MEILEREGGKDGKEKISILSSNMQRKLTPSFGNTCEKTNVLRLTFGNEVYKDGLGIQQFSYVGRRMRDQENEICENNPE